MAELALMFASRAQHITEVIEPALAEGRIVLCDRFTDSTEAYQGGGRKLGSEPVLALHRILCHGLQPDLTILMDSDVAASVERARRRNKADAAKNGRASTTRIVSSRRVALFWTECTARTWQLLLASRTESCWSMREERQRETHARIVEIVRRKMKLARRRREQAVSYQLSVHTALGIWHLARAPWESRTLFSVILLDSTNLARAECQLLLAKCSLLAES